MPPKADQAGFSRAAVPEGPGDTPKPSGPETTGLRPNPREAEASRRQGYAFVKERRLEEAEACFRQAIALQPDLTRAYIGLSAIQRSTDRKTEAQATFEQGIGHKPWYRMGAKHMTLINAMITRGTQNAYYDIGRSSDGTLGIARRRGHYSTKYLLSSNFITRKFFYLNGENILDDASVPDHDVVINTIADPDLEDRSLRLLSAYLTRKPHVPVINHPDRILQIGREQNFERLGGLEGIVFPKTSRIATAGKADDVVVREIKADGFEFPLLARKVGTHTGSSFALIEDETQLLAYLGEYAGGDLYVIDYIEELLRGTYFRKLRFFCVDGRLYPVVCHIDEMWNVHGDNRKILMARYDWMKDEERRFLKDPKTYIGPDNYRRMLSLHQVLGLDFYGIDFTIRGDGRILIYEANPSMRNHANHVARFPYQRRYVQAVARAFTGMVMKRAIKAEARNLLKALRLRT